MQESIAKYGPGMEKFFYGMMQGGGMQDVQPLIDAATKQHGADQESIRASVMSSGLPMQSTGMARSLGRELGQSSNQFGMNVLNTQLKSQSDAMQRQFGGAQGLGGMPGYYGQPSGLEMSLLGMQQPYDMARFGGGMAQQGMQSDFYNRMLGNEFQGNYMEPSDFQKYIGSWLNPLLGAAGNVGSTVALGGGG